MIIIIIMLMHVGESVQTEISAGWITRKCWRRIDAADYPHSFPAAPSAVPIFTEQLNRSAGRASFERSQLSDDLTVPIWSLLPPCDAIALVRFSPSAIFRPNLAFLQRVLSDEMKCHQCQMCFAFGAN